MKYELMNEQMSHKFHIFLQMCVKFVFNAWYICVKCINYEWIFFAWLSHEMLSFWWRFLWKKHLSSINKMVKSETILVKTCNICLLILHKFQPTSHWELKFIQGFLKWFSSNAYISCGSKLKTIYIIFVMHLMRNPFKFKKLVISIIRHLKFILWHNQ
jgi:hypothetical protein